MTDYSAEFPIGNSVTRRDALRLLGLTTIGATAIVGCSSGNTAGADRILNAAVPYDPPPKGNFNSFLQWGGQSGLQCGFLVEMILLPGALYYWSSQKYHYMLAASSTQISADGTTLTYKVRDGLRWSDGKPITGRDVYSTWLCYYALGAPTMTNYVDRIEHTDAMTVTFHLSSPSPTAIYDLLRGRIVSDAVYGEYARQAEPLKRAGRPSTDKSVAAVAQRLQAVRPKQVTASGAFTFDYGSITNAELRLVKNKFGYRAKEIPWDSITVYNGDAGVVTPLVLAKKVTYTNANFPVATEKEFIQKHIRILRPPNYYGPALRLSLGKHPEFRDKRVRQALAHAIDRDQTAEIAMGQVGKTGVKLMACITDEQVPHYLSPKDQSKLAHYEYDRSKAEQLLTASGWSKHGGRWTTSNGNQASYTLLARAADLPSTNAAQNVVSQLNDFGFKIELLAEEEQQVEDDVYSSKFDIVMDYSGPGGNPSPEAAFNGAFLAYNYSPGAASKRGMDFPLKQTTEIVGAIDLEKAVPATGAGTTEELKAKVTRVALAFNELLPLIPLYETYSNNPVLEDKATGWPADDDPLNKNMPFSDSFVPFVLYDGTLKPA